MSTAETLGIVGGGQLGMMLTEAAKPLGFHVVVIDPTAECPAWQAGAEQIQADWTDGDAIRDLAKRAGVITWESEHIDTEALADLPVRVEPSPRMLATTQDKLTQKEYLRRHGIPVADFAGVQNEADLQEVFGRFGEVMLKTRFGGYDGRGNKKLTSPGWSQLPASFVGKPLYAEKIVPFRKELATIVARDRQGALRPYPVVETIHHNNICHMVLAPPDISPYLQRDAKDIALETVRHLEGAGVFAVEMFLTDDDTILVNEIAPRVHNSGHLTAKANATSQFEQHVRAVMGLPLGSMEQITPAAVMINILGERNGPVDVQGRESVLALPNTHLQLYGKSPTRLERKMGHITVLADYIDVARERALQARREFSI